jgi:Flp pilus assembly protein TadD
MLDRSFAKAFVNRANVYQGSKKFDRALADFSEAVRLNLNDAYSLYSRGLIMRSMGREDEARVDIARAKDIEPGIGP